MNRDYGGYQHTSGRYNDLNTMSAMILQICAEMGYHRTELTFNFEFIIVIDLNTRNTLLLNTTIQIRTSFDSYIHSSIPVNIYANVMWRTVFSPSKTLRKCIKNVRIVRLYGTYVGGEQYYPSNDIQPCVLGCVAGLLALA